MLSCNSLIVILVFSSPALAEAPWWDMGRWALSNTEAIAPPPRELTLSLQAFARALKADKSRTIEEKNDIFRDEVLRAAEIENVKRYGQLVAQMAIEDERPLVGFGWNDLHLTAAQVEAISDIEIPTSLERQITKDYRHVIAAALQKYMRPELLTKEMGEPFWFDSRNGGIFADLWEQLDIEPVRLLQGPRIRKELELDVGQAKASDALLKRYRATGRFIFTAKDTDQEREPLAKEELEEIRVKALADAMEILRDDQKARFKQILLQLYLQPKSFPIQALRVLGIDTDEIPDSTQLILEHAAIKRLRLILFYRDELEPIVGKRVVDRLIGKPAFRTIRKKRPQLDTDLAQELLAVANGGSKNLNPRRRDR